MPPPLPTYRPFLDALPIWSIPWSWALLLFPLCLGVSVVYKSIRCRSMAKVPREAAGLFLFIAGGFMATALALAGLAWWMR